MLKFYDRVLDHLEHGLLVAVAVLVLLCLAVRYTNGAPLQAPLPPQAPAMQEVTEPTEPAATKPAKPRKASCGCSSGCTCGCQETGVCDCDRVVVHPQVRPFVPSPVTSPYEATPSLFRPIPVPMPTPRPAPVMNYAPQLMTPAAPVARPYYAPPQLRLRQPQQSYYLPQPQPQWQPYYQPSRPLMPPMMSGRSFGGGGRRGGSC